MNFFTITIIVCFSVMVNAKFKSKSYIGDNNKHKNAEGRYTRNIEDYEIVVPQKVNDDSSFLSFFLPYYYDYDIYYKGIQKRDVSNKRRDEEEHNVHYKVEIGGKSHHLQLTPNWKLVPESLVLEKRALDYKRNINNLKIRQIGSNHKCHYTGVVKGERNSRAAISLCDGLAGYIKTNDNTYFIEPLKDHEAGENGQHFHVVYKRSLHSQNPEVGTCGTSDDWEKSWEERLIWQSLTHGGHEGPFSKRSTSKKNTIETLIVADKRFLEHHNGTDMETYILTIMNMVSNYYRDSSIGNEIDITIVRIMYLEKEKEELDLVINQDSSKTLESFCKWQVSLNPDIGHPNHHDMAVLLTRYDLCADGNCDLLGLAYVATACEPDKSCCINEDNGLILGITVAHEMGHVMGCSHDELESSGCTPESREGFYNVMSPFVHLSTEMWSKCSRKFVTDFLDLNLGECLENEPSEHSFRRDDMLPGAVYDANSQCAMLYGPNVPVCVIDESKFCEMLFCKTSQQSCSSESEPPADGTSCGNNKWCYQKKCISMGSRPNAINGGWGDWGPVSECSRTCGGGVSVSERECDNPKPSHKGRYCLGIRKRYSICNTQPCDPGEPNYHETQCSAKDLIKINGKKHVWKPFFKPKSNPCELFCVNEEHVYMKLEKRVKDGTPCKLGTKDLCIEGVCRTVGCDWKLDSDAIVDVCGICRGDGTHCDKVEDIYSQRQGRGYVEIATIPKNSRNIRIEELAPVENTIAISSEDHSTFYLNEDFSEQKDGEYNFGKKAIGIYSHVEPQKEVLEINGPIKEDLILYVVFYGHDNPGIKYSYYVPKEGSNFLPRYHWEFLQWKDCSVECGGGVKISEPSCVEEKAGEVSDSFCKSMPKPEKKEERCNEQQCPTRWKKGKWGECSGCTDKLGWQFREVQCIKKTGENTDEEALTENSECKGRRPRKKRKCKSDKPCRKRRDPTKASKSDLKIGTIAKDPVPNKDIKLIEVPIVTKSKTAQTKLSDEAYQKLGDKVPIDLDFSKAKTYTGKEAVDKENEIKEKHE